MTPQFKRGVKCVVVYKEKKSQILIWWRKFVFVKITKPIVVMVIIWVPHIQKMVKITKNI